MYKQIEFTREDLYKMVWERPVLVIAKEIGVSDVAVAKACRKAEIPLPNRGHWAIVKAGRAVNPPPLPKPKPDQPDSVWFTVLENPLPKLPKVEISVGPLIKVPTELVKPHRLVAELKAAANGQKEDKGVIPLNYHKFLRVRTSTAQLERALILMDTLIKQFEYKGCKVRVSEKSAQTELVLKEGTIVFRLDERTKQTPPPQPPPRPPGRRGEHHYEPWRPAYILVGTGEFTLEFSGGISSCPSTWKDRIKASLEAQLHEVISAIPSWDAALLSNRIQREEREAKEREAEKRCVAAARAQEILRLQRVRLVNNLRAWEQAERLRRFIAAFEQKGDQGPEAQAWLEWAHRQVQTLDPLCADLKGVIDLSVELSEYFTGRGPWEKQPVDWWYLARQKQPLLGSVEDFEEALEEGMAETNALSQPDDLETKPAWHPNQWYTRLHR
ncbi:hypothetical protein ABXT00_03135 [Stenotrophomonas koreensis]|uniref:hypothetical protein n=1 Tax=Stenotrophomonas koreensis TaxID=266128 RepID=UPI003393A14F